jgi:broad specificity phosphatase PhoE
MEVDYDRLSAMGEEQARRLGAYWVRHGLTFDRVFHGPAKRHIRTAEVAGEVVKQAGLPWPELERVDALDEFDAFTMMKRVLPSLIGQHESVRRLHDDFRANHTSPEAGRLLQKLFEEACRYWCTGEYDVPGVESWAQFRERIAGALKHMTMATPQSSRAIAFTSAGPIAATVAHSLELPPNKAIEFVWMSRNASYAQFLFSNGRMTMHSFNSIPHLDDLSLLTYR